MALVLGLGEIGLPLYEILKGKYPTTVGFDKKTGWIDQKATSKDKVDFLHICLPYFSDFINCVEEYQSLFNPDLTIIHSTVPVGTTAKIRNAVHSPVLGNHKTMRNDLFKFIKWIGGKFADEAEVHMALTGIPCKTIKTSEETELLKLMCLAKYGMSIAFAQYQKDCFDKFGFDYSHVLEWDMNYNMNVKPYQCRPLIKPPGKRISGHCVIPGTRMFNDSFPNPILEEVLKYA